MLVLDPFREVIDIVTPEWSATLEGGTAENPDTWTLSVPHLAAGESVTISIRGHSITLTGTRKDKRRVAFLIDDNVSIHRRGARCGPRVP